MDINKVYLGENMKCKDCGQEKPEGKYGTRRDVCSECWENRSWVLNNIPKLGLSTFKTIQKKMAYGHGSAKAYIESLKISFGE